MTRIEACSLLARARAELIQIEERLAVECSCGHGHRGARLLTVALVCGLRLRLVLAHSAEPDTLQTATDLDARWCAILPGVLGPHAARAQDRALRSRSLG